MRCPLCKDDSPESAWALHGTSTTHIDFVDGEFVVPEWSIATIFLTHATCPQCRQTVSFADDPIQVSTDAPDDTIFASLRKRIEGGRYDHPED